MTSNDTTAAPILRLIGVYHANGGVLGELTYMVGKIRGTTSCALCDITHRGVRRKPAWNDFVCQLAVPFDLVHLNERTPAVAAASEGRTPCILAETATALVFLLGPDDLAESSDVTTFTDTLQRAVGKARLAWPDA